MSDPNGVCATVNVAVDKLLAVADQEFSLVPGFGNDLSRLRASLQKIKELLVDAERRRATDVGVRYWFDVLADAAYDADNVLDEIGYENLRLLVEGRNETKSKWFCFDSKTGEEFRSKMAPEINRIIVKLERIVDEGTIGLNLAPIIGEGDSNLAPLLPVIREDDFIARDFFDFWVRRQNDESELVSMLINPSSDDTVSVIPIVGMGGTGKTTLARFIFNDPRVKGHFDERRWVVAPRDFDATRILKGMLRSSEETFPEEAVRKLRDKLEGKRYLLVLDDLWNENVQAWNHFRNALEGINTSKGGNAILVTTRSMRVAAIVSPHRDPYCVQLLTYEECWSIIKARAFREHQVPAQFVSIGKDIARKCQGLPLAASLIGASLRGKTLSQWQLMREDIGNSMQSDNVQRVLQLSYEALPSSSLKICFFYCSVFPKDSVLHREKLVQLWMAQGFLPHLEGTDVEAQGNLYFDSLLERNLFQGNVVDKVGNVVSCKMHDLVHDLACSISNSQTYRWDNLTVDKIPKVRYLAVESLQVQEGRKGFRQENTSNIRSLSSKANIANNMLPLFSSLRSLILREAYIKDLPISVDKLIRLRYLDASSNPIERLPHSVCKLYHLETLRIFTLNLQELPEKLHNLISLRHLHFNGQQIEMPPNIGRLSSLRTLSSFNVSDKEGCRIDELGHLKKLGGKLTIRNLELVKDKEEAMKADLIRKENIYKLKFIWSKSREGNNNDQNVLDGLQPHQNLKSIKIEGFRGQNFPSWTSKMAMHDLVQIKITHCDTCENIPMLGHLSLLKYLEFDGLTSLRTIHTSFYGDDQESTGCTVYFPSLERLVLKKMFNLVDWKKPAITPDEECGVQQRVFPRLEYLELNGCCQLMDAPITFPSLRNLYFRSVKNDSLLGEIFINSLHFLTKLHIACANQLTCLPDRLFYDNDKLQELSIYSCLKLKELPEGLDCLKSIEKLEIGDCPCLQSIPYPSGVEGLASLRHAKISCCPGLSSLPSGMFMSCTSLQSLMIGGLANLTSLPLAKWEMDYLVSLKLHKCPKATFSLESIGRLHRLTELSIGQFSESVDISSFPGMQHLNSLHTLTLYGWPSCDTLPIELMHLTSLSNLVLLEWGMTALPEWLGNLSSLQELELRRCEKLQHMPPEEAMRRLTRLKKLYIQDCPELEERCQPTHPDSQSNKISHIPVVEIGPRSIRFRPFFLKRNN